MSGAIRLTLPGNRKADRTQSKKIIREVEKYPARHVVITGGEPLLAPELAELAAKLKAAGRHITIETAATIYRAVPCDLFSLSPKLANSTPWKRAAGKFAPRHEGAAPEFFRHPKLRRQLRLSAEIRRRAKGRLRRNRADSRRLEKVDRSRVLIMPEGTTRRALTAKAKWLVELCKQNGYGFTPRLHIELIRQSARHVIAREIAR